MKIISKKNHYGCRVLFLWCSIPLTGTVKSIGEVSFGIVCDSNHYVTDKLLIPRQGNEIFIEKTKCLKTGEIVPIIMKTNQIPESEKFSDVRVAYFHLPKFSIFPGAVGFNENAFIRFIPEKHIFQLKNGEQYLLTQISNGLTTLVDINNPVHFETPNWKFQPDFQYNPDVVGIDEDMIEKVFSIPEPFVNENAKNLMKLEIVNTIFNIGSLGLMSLTHNVRQRNDDVNITDLPDEIAFDPSGFKK